MSRASRPNASDLLPPSARRVPRSRRGDGWNTLADIEAFVFAVEAELEAMDRERIGVHRRGCKPDLALRRRLIGLIWTLTSAACSGALPAGSQAFPSPPCTAASRAG